jgi:Niemann-Pick C1 protein
VALPRDSFLQDYYEDVFGFLRVGPPLMLVVNNLNVSRDSGDVNSVCSIAGCQDDSLLNRVRARMITRPSHVHVLPNP